MLGSSIDVLLRFPIVVLGMAAILGETTKAKRQKMWTTVATVGVALGDVYGETLLRIREQNDSLSRLGMQVLMWVSYSQRPLQIDELCHALAVEIGSTDLNLDNAPSIDTVLDSCLGLVIIDKNSTLHLIHHSLREYLSSQSIFPRAHQTLAETCLTCLNFSGVNNISSGCASDLPYTSFLKYSSIYWGIHAKGNLSDRAKSLAVELLSRNDNHISATLLFQHIVDGRNDNNACGYLLFQYLEDDHPDIFHHQFTGLHRASYFGIVEVVKALVEMKGSDINQGDCIGCTPLMWAAQRGNEGVVRILLARGDVDPDKSDNHVGTPLSGASSEGHEGIVRQLLARESVNPNKPDNSGGTPLKGASCYGHEGVVRLLLARGDVNPNVTESHGGTPLWWASCVGHEGVVRLLLARSDVNPDQANHRGETPLWCASSEDTEGHEEVVRLLLARSDVNPDQANYRGESPLWRASSEGNEGVVRILLARRDINPDRPDNCGRTPLALAASRGYVSVVKLLLARPDVNPGTPDDQGQTPLQVASTNGHRKIVALLKPRI